MFCNIPRIGNVIYRFKKYGIFNAKNHDSYMSLNLQQYSHVYGPLNIHKCS